MCTRFFNQIIDYFVIISSRPLDLFGSTSSWVSRLLDLNLLHLYHAFHSTTNSLWIPTSIPSVDRHHATVFFLILSCIYCQCLLLPLFIYLYLLTTAVTITSTALLLVVAAAGLAYYMQFQKGRIGFLGGCTQCWVVLAA